MVQHRYPWFKVHLVWVLAGCGPDPESSSPSTGCAAIAYVDADGDGYGDETLPLVCEGVSVGGDCDDTDPAISPDGAEVCDGSDNDCSGAADEGLLSTFYPDRDGDGFGQDGEPVEACTAPSGYIALGGDCDDADSATHSGAAEVCDGADNDCDSVVDNGFESAWHRDADGDGYGSDDDTVESCSAPSGYVASGGDCDDADATISPGAEDALGEDVDCTPGVSLELVDLALLGEDKWSYAGLSVSIADDLDGDGLDEVLVGSYSLGEVYLFTGEVLSTATGDLFLREAQATFSDDGGDESFGRTARGVGDMDGDGISEIAIGAPELDGVGAVCLISGAALEEAPRCLPGVVSGGNVGVSLDSAGDVNGDGLADLITGSWRASSERGQAYLLFGGGSATSMDDADVTLSGVWSTDRAGVTIAGAGDVDGDGLDDVLVGASGGAPGGAVYLVLADSLTSDLSLGDADYRLDGREADDEAGRAISGAGDVDGDGLDDVLVGASRQDAGRWRGEAYLVAGGDLGADSIISLDDAAFRFFGSQAEDEVGSAVASAGDVDGDGAPDILIGARGSDSGYDDSQAYLLLNAELPAPGAYELSLMQHRFNAESVGAWVGGSLAGGGDLNGDGLDDFVIGAYGGAGAVYVVRSGW